MFEHLNILFSFVLIFHQQISHCVCLKMRFVVFFLVFSVLITVCLSVCCRDTFRFNFRILPGKRCSDYSSESFLPHRRQTRCHVDVCGDGKKVAGTYCGVGPCNIFGCNCDGGCISGNGKEKFLREHSDVVED